MKDLILALEDKIERLEEKRARRIFVDVSRENLQDAVKILASSGVTHLSTISGVDAGDRIEVLYHFFGKGNVITLRTWVPKQDPKLKTITQTIPGAILYEREVHDLLGVEFEGHPDMRRLILPEDWESGPPLRKEWRME